MSNSLVLFHSTGHGVAPVQEAVQALKEALAQAVLAPPITDTESRQAVVDAMSCIKTLMAAAEKSRKALKEPVLRSGQLIDEAKDLFCAPLVKAYAELDERLAQWEDDKAALEAEQARLRQKELDEFAHQLPAPKDDKEAAEQSELLQQKADELGPLVDRSPAKGQSIRERYDYEVLDLGTVWTHYGSRLVTLKEKRQAILDLINSGQCPTAEQNGVRVPVVPGLRIRVARSSRIQGKRPEKALDVSAEIVP